METYTFTPSGPVCTKCIQFSIEDGKLHDVAFTSGCPGNLKAIAKLVEGRDAEEVAHLLQGNDCGGRGTSCADQLSSAIRQAVTNA